MWGLSAQIDLYGCDPKLIDDHDYIFAFAVKLCQLIQMERYGDPQIVRFGDDPKVAGYTLVQLLTTSALTAHFVPHSSAVYLDLFSCQEYDPAEVDCFCKEWFKARWSDMQARRRG